MPGSSTATWVRVRLAAPADQRTLHRLSMTEGELVLRADRVSPREEVRVKPEFNPLFDIYVQSTSVNRKLVPGTKLLVLQ